MEPTANVFGNEWDLERTTREGAYVRLLHVGHRVCSELIGGTLMEVGPGYRGRYHLHYGNEELVLVLAGQLALRSEDGQRELSPGDLALFPRGHQGLHALENRSDERARFMLFSSKVYPDVTERPEEGLVGVFVGDVPTLGRVAPFEAFFPRDAALD